MKSSLESLMTATILVFALIGGPIIAHADGKIPLPRSKPQVPSSSTLQGFKTQTNINSAGTVLVIKGQATAIGRTGNRSLKKASAIYAGDIIKTGFLGNVQLLFADNTKLAIGPRSKITIDDFVLNTNDSQATASIFAIKAARGTFRFLTGNSDKAAYKISTKTATIGIRGTGFDFAYRGRTSVVLYKGAVEVCLGTSCAQLINKCEMAVEQGGQIYKSHASQLPPGAFKLTFPYIRRENNLSKSYRLKAADCDVDGGSSPGLNGGSRSGFSGGGSGGFGGGTGGSTGDAGSSGSGQ